MVLVILLMLVKIVLLNVVEIANGIVKETSAFQNVSSKSLMMLTQAGAPLRFKREGCELGDNIHNVTKCIEIFGKWL